MQHRLTVHPSERLRILVVVMAVGAAACTAGSPAPPTDTPPANRVRCSGVIDSVDQPDAWFPHQILDVIALPADLLDLGRDGDPDTPYEGLRFAKFGLLIRADRALTLEIVHVQPGTAVMQWIPLEDPDRPTTRLHVGPCPGDSYEWIVFSGGLRVSNDPICVTLAVAADGRSEETRLGVEAPCP